MKRGAQKGLRGKVKPMRIAQHGIATIVTQQWQSAGTHREKFYT